MQYVFWSSELRGVNYNWKSQSKESLKFDFCFRPVSYFQKISDNTNCIRISGGYSK